MPPRLAWFAGREHVGLFLRTHVLRQAGDFRLIQTAANGQPAVAEYRRGPDGVFRAHGVAVLTFTGSRIARIVSFLDPGLLPAFDLPQALPAV
jgi:RNA polymerase sigma-70 factor, ECF subfamily